MKSKLSEFVNYSLVNQGNFCNSTNKTFLLALENDFTFIVQISLYYLTLWSHEDIEPATVDLASKTLLKDERHLCV